VLSPIYAGCNITFRLSEYLKTDHTLLPGVMVPLASAEAEDIQSATVWPKLLATGRRFPILSIACLFSAYRAFQKMRNVFGFGSNLPERVCISFVQTGLSDVSGLKTGSVESNKYSGSLCPVELRGFPSALLIQMISTLWTTTHRGRLQQFREVYRIFSDISLRGSSKIEQNFHWIKDRSSRI